jgi:hypothetical protein
MLGVLINQKNEEQMVIIETNNWGKFEAPTLEKAKEKMVECLAQHEETNCDISNIFIDGFKSSESETNQISTDIEQEIYEWLAVAKIESEGLRRAQQESMEVR